MLFDYFIPAFIFDYLAEHMRLYFSTFCFYIFEIKMLVLTFVSCFA